MKKVIITGGSGFLGSAISQVLLSKGYQVVSLDMRPPQVTGVEYVEASVLEAFPQNPLLESPYGVINLAGKSIFGYWSRKHKKLMRGTRVMGTANLVESFATGQYRPEVLVSASAVGIYGDAGETEVDEASLDGIDFLARLTRDWEAEAKTARNLGVRTHIIRNGHILGVVGILGVLVPYYRKGLGGPLSNGKQWMPWIHIVDCVAMYVQALEDPSFPALINAVAPEQVRNKEFSKMVARILRKPHIVRIPLFLLRFLYGEFGTAMVMSQRVRSQYAFTFQFPTLEGALRNVLGIPAELSHKES